MLLELKPEVVFSLCQYYREKYGRLPENDREIQFMIITLLKGSKKYIEKWLIKGLKWYKHEKKLKYRLNKLLNHLEVSNVDKYGYHYLHSIILFLILCYNQEIWTDRNMWDLKVSQNIVKKFIIFICKNIIKLYLY